MRTSPNNDSYRLMWMCLKTHLDVRSSDCTTGSSQRTDVDRCGGCTEAAESQKYMDLWSGPGLTGRMGSSLAFGGLSFCSDKWDFLDFMHIKTALLKKKQSLKSLQWSQSP